MKKLLALLLTVCMLMSVVMIPVSAAIVVDGKEIEADDPNYVGISDGTSLDGWKSNNGAKLSIDDSTLNGGVTATAVRFDYVATGNGGGTSFYVEYTLPGASRLVAQPTGLDISGMKYLTFDLWVDTPETAEILNKHVFMFEITSSARADHQEMHVSNTFLNVAGVTLTTGWNHIEIPLSVFARPTEGSGPSKGPWDPTRWNFFRIYNDQAGNGFSSGYSYSFMLDNFCFTAGDSNVIPMPDTRISTNTTAAQIGLLANFPVTDVTGMTHLCFDVDVPVGTDLDKLNTTEFRFEVRSEGGGDAKGETELSDKWVNILNGNRLHEGLNHVEIPLAYFDIQGERHDVGLDWAKFNYIRIHHLSQALTYSNFYFIEKDANSEQSLLVSKCDGTDGKWIWNNPTYDKTVTDKSADGVVVYKTVAGAAGANYLIIQFDQYPTYTDIRGYRYMEFDLYIASATEDKTDAEVAAALNTMLFYMEIQSRSTDKWESAARNVSFKQMTGKDLVAGWNHVRIDLSLLGKDSYAEPCYPTMFRSMRIYCNSIPDASNAVAATLMVDNFGFAKEEDNETVVVDVEKTATASETSTQYVFQMPLGRRYDLTERDTLEFDLTILNEEDAAALNAFQNYFIELSSSGRPDQLEIAYSGPIACFAEGGKLTAGKNHLSVPLSKLTIVTNSTDASYAFYSANPTFAPYRFDKTRCDFLRLFTNGKVASTVGNTVVLNNVKFTRVDGVKTSETRHETYSFKVNGHINATAEEFRYLKDATVFGAVNAYASVNNGGSRYADKDAKIIYGFPIANYKSAVGLTLSGTFSNQLQMDVAVAPAGADANELKALTWTTVFSSGETKLSSENKTISFEEILPTLKAMTGDVVLYVRIGDSTPGNGFGGMVVADSTLTLDVAYKVSDGDMVTSEISVWQGYLPGSSMTAEEWKSWVNATKDVVEAMTNDLYTKYGGGGGKEVVNTIANGYLLQGQFLPYFRVSNDSRFAKLYHDQVGEQYAQVFAYTIDEVGEVIDANWDAFVSGHVKLQVYVGPKVANVASLPADAEWVTLYDHSVEAGEHANSARLEEVSTMALGTFHADFLKVVKEKLSDTNNTIYIRQYNPCTRGWGGGVHMFAPGNFVRTAVGLNLRMKGETTQVNLGLGGKVTIDTTGLSVIYGSECSPDGAPAYVDGTITNIEGVNSLSYEYIWMTDANVKLDSAPSTGGRYKVGIKVADNANGYYGYAELPVFEINHVYSNQCDDTCDMCGEQSRVASHNWTMVSRDALVPSEANGWASATIHEFCNVCNGENVEVIARDPGAALYVEGWKNSVGTIGTADIGDQIGGKGVITLTANGVSGVGGFKMLFKAEHPIDISDMDYLVFDLYVPAEAVKPFNEKQFMLELTSSGTQDKQEDAFQGTMAALACKPIVEGWNHVAIPLSSVAGKTDGGLNKTAWNFMRLFNNEKWDPAVSFTVGITNFHFASEKESDFRTIFSFRVLSEEEKSYLDSSNAGSTNAGARYADNDKILIYRYALGSNAANLENIYWSAAIFGQARIEVGVAASGSKPANWYTVYAYEVATPGSNDDKGLNEALRAYDLLAVLKKNNVTLADNDTLYLRFSDTDTSTGWGAALRTSKPVTLALDYKITSAHDDDTHLVDNAYGEKQHWKYCISCHAIVGEKVDHTWDSPCDPDCNDGRCGYVRAVAHVTDGSGYEYTGTEHWQVCMKCVEVINRGDHVFDNECDATCNLCGFERNVHHNTDGKWLSNASGHWMICADCNEKVDFEEHKYDNLCGGTCEVCGFVHDVEHTWADTMGMDEHDHWYVCAVCGEKDEVEAHVFDSACDKDCNICGYIREVEHKFSEDWSSNDAGHYHACVNCGEPDKIIAHTFSDDCDETCDVCGYTRTAPHTTNGVWESDDEQHWQNCTKCGKKVNLAVHVFDNDCDADCNICGATREIEHAWSQDYASDEDGHWHVCEKCGAKQAAEAHAFGDDCGTTCNVCGFVRGAVEHVYNGDWTFDENNHWHACSNCGGAIQDSAAHTWNAGKATVGGVTVHTCTVCGAIKTVKADTERPAPEVKPVDETVKLPEDVLVVVEDVTSTIENKVVDRIKDELKTNKGVYTLIGKDSKVVAIFDVSLVSGGAKVQPDGKVKVTVPADTYENKSGVDYMVVYVDADGNLTPCETTRGTDGSLEFITDHFSHYAIIGSTTSGGATVWVFVLIGVVALAAVAVVVVVTMKKKKANA